MSFGEKKTSSLLVTFPSAWHLEMSGRSYEKKLGQKRCINSQLMRVLKCSFSHALIVNQRRGLVSERSPFLSSCVWPQQPGRLTNSARPGLRLTQANGKMAPGPDAEVEEQVLVELLQQRAVALGRHLVQQHLTRHQDVHVHHAAGNLQPEESQSRVTPAPLHLFVVRLCFVLL